MGSREWLLSRTNPEFLEYLSRSLRVSRVTAQLLVNRGFTEPVAAARFLNPSAETLNDPFLLSGIDLAVERIKTGVTRNETIAIYGDYDVDGLTATALMVETLRAMGGSPRWYVPDRLREGYGLSERGLRRLASDGVTLVISVDCGITAAREADIARRLGLDLVITDHHHPGETLPAAVAVVNPRLPGETYPFADLAGVGVAWKLAVALRGADEADSLLDLVALGTVADVVPLGGEHRWMVRRGLQRIEAGLRPGLRALRRVARVENRRIGASELGFIFGPRINAAGRLGDAMPVVDLLLTRDDEQADVLAAFLNKNNQMRQGIEQDVLGEVETRLDESAGEGPVVLSGAGWHPGVVGIVAARVVERVHSPVFLFAEDDGVARGSGRGVEGFHLVEALERCRDLFLEFGGHAMAAGVTMEVDKIPAFRERFREIFAESGGRPTGSPPLRLEAVVQFRDLNSGFLTELEGLEPFGCGNEEPVFGARRVEVLGRDTVGKKHLRLRLRQDRTVLDGIAFSKGDAWQWLREGDLIDIACTPMEDRWNGRVSVRLQVRDVRPAT